MILINKSGFYCVDLNDFCLAIIPNQIKIMYKLAITNNNQFIFISYEKVSKTTNFSISNNLSCSSKVINAIYNHFRNMYIE